MKRASNAALRAGAATAAIGLAAASTALACAQGPTGPTQTSNSGATARTHAVSFDQARHVDQGRHAIGVHGRIPHVIPPPRPVPGPQPRHGAGRGLSRHPAVGWQPTPDERWLERSILTDRFELALGRIAAARGDAAIEPLISRVAADDTKSLEQASSLASRIGMPTAKYHIPSTPEGLGKLGEAPAAVFDHTYARLEVRLNGLSLTSAEEEAQEGRDNAIRSLAEAQVPTLRSHLALAEGTLASTSSSTSTTDSPVTEKA